MQSTDYHCSAFRKKKSLPHARIYSEYDNVQPMASDNIGERYDNYSVTRYSATYTTLTWPTTEVYHE